MISTWPMPPGVPAGQFVDHEQVLWREAMGYARGGAQEKILYCDPATGMYVRLLRWPPGFVSGTAPLHHDDIEEFAWVVDGESMSTSSGRSHCPGMFCVVPARMDHGPFVTRTGITLLEVRRPINPAECHAH